MSVIRSKVVAAGLCGFAMIVIVSFNIVAAQTQAAPPCCVDRWGPGWKGRGMWGPGMMSPEHRQRMLRHRAFMHAGVPAEYRGLRNPLALTADVVQAGGVLYQQQCAACHGREGMGDGEAGKDLSPSPALLEHVIQMPMSVDEYLMWSIAEGGKAFGTAMPVFKDALSQEERWKIIAYMRAGFPPGTKSN